MTSIGILLKSTTLSRKKTWFFAFLAIFATIRDVFYILYVLPMNYRFIDFPTDWSQPKNSKDGVKVPEKILSSQQKTKEKIQTFPDKKLEPVEKKDSSLDFVKEWIGNVKTSIENLNYGMNELVTLDTLDGTPLKNTMLSILKNPQFDDYPDLKGKTPEQRLEFVFRKINIALTKFYARKLNIGLTEPVPDYLKKVVIPATELFLMETLAQMGNETNINFLGQLSSMDFSSLGNLVTQVKDFSEKFSFSFGQGKTLLNLTDFLALPKNQAQLSKLDDPYEFYQKVLKNPLWKQDITTKDSPKPNQISLDSITWEQFDLRALKNNLSNEEKQQAFQMGKEKMKQQLWSIKMVETPETMKKMLWILEKADGVFQNIDALGNKLLDSMDVLGNTSKVLKSTLGFDLWKQIRKTPALGGVLNVVLGVLGFSGGVEGLERAWKKRILERELKQPQKAYIAESYKNYMQKKALQATTAKTLLDQHNLKVEDAAQRKFALDMPLIKSQILQKIDEKPELLNFSTLKMTKSPVFKGEDFVQEVKVGEKTKLALKRKLTPQEREAFVDTYLHEGLERFASNPKALSSLPNADTLAFILLSGVALNKDDVIDGVEAQVFLPDQYTDAVLATQNGQDRYIYPNGSAPIGNNKPVVNPNNPVVNSISPNPSAESINNFVENLGQKPESGNDINNDQLDEALWRHGYNGSLLFYDKIPWTEEQKKAFKQKMEKIAAELDINPNRLMALMASETWGTFNPAIANKSTWATGLIQIMPSTATKLGTTVSALRSMSAVQQLDYVKKYYQLSPGKKFRSLKDLYLYTFFPIAMNHSSNPNYVFQSSTISAARLAGLHRKLARGKSYITMWDFNYYISGMVNQNVPVEFRNQFA